MDEFALWVRLQDVYRSEEGRVSFEAVLVATAFAALVLTRPLRPRRALSIAGSAVVVAVVVVLALVCIAKGRIMLGVVGIFVPPVAAVGAVRLAHPHSL